MTAQNFPYRAWIPNVTGTLSFRKVGESTFPSPTRVANLVTLGAPHEELRLIIAYQRRNLSDALFSSLRDLQHRKYMWFVVFLSATRKEHMTDDCLSGTVFIFTSKKSWQEAKESLTGARFAPALKTEIERFNGRISASHSGGQPPLETFHDLKRWCKSVADVQVDCQIQRDGIALIAKPIFREDNVEVASQAYARNLGHNIYEWIANQVYCFLRDISHQHQHHHGSADTLLSVQEYDEDKPDDWKFRIMYSLQHFVIDSKRRRSIASLIHCKGIVAYRDSFVVISGIAKKPTVTDSRFLLSSIDAQIESNSTSNNHIMRGLGFVQSIFAWLAIALALSTLLLQPQIKALDQPGPGTLLMRGLAERLEQSLNWGTISGAIIVPFLLYFGISLYASLKFDGHERRIHRQLRLIFRDFLVLLTYVAYLRVAGLKLTLVYCLSMLAAGSYLIYRAVQLLFGV